MTSDIASMDRQKAGETADLIQLILRSGEGITLYRKNWWGDLHEQELTEKEQTLLQDLLDMLRERERGR